MTSNSTPAIQLRWLRHQPRHGPAYRVLAMGKVFVGKVGPAIVGTGYRAEVFLPGAKIEGNGVAHSEEYGETMVEAAVRGWLMAAGLGKNGVVVGDSENG